MLYNLDEIRSVSKEMSRIAVEIKEQISVINSLLTLNFFDDIYMDSLTIETE